MWFWVRKSSWSRWTDTEVQTKDFFRVQPPTSASGHIPDAFHRVSWVFFSSEKEGDHHTHVLCQAAFFHPVFISPFLVYIHLKAEVKLRLSWQPGLLSVAPGKPLSESTTSPDTLRGQWPLLGVFSKKILWKHFPDIPWNLQQPLAPRLSGSKVIISTCNGITASLLHFSNYFSDPHKRLASTTPNGRETRRWIVSVQSGVCSVFLCIFLKNNKTF